jgi:hypothetical protein
MHVVEISRVDGKLAETMRPMRGWLDNCDLGSLLFRLTAACHRLEFVEESDAAVFAHAFSGCIVEDHAEARLDAPVFAPVARAYWIRLPAEDSVKRKQN